MTSIEHNGRKFLLFDYAPRGAAHSGIPSIWVCGSVSKGMTNMKFTGNFAIHDSRHGSHHARGGSRRDSDVLERSAKKLPCRVNVRMMGAPKGQRVVVLADLLFWEKIDEKTIGVSLGGICQ